MALPLLAKRKARGISVGIFLVGLGLILYYGTVWPDILMVIGLSLGVKQYIRGRIYDVIVTATIFGGIYSYYKLNLNWDFVLPVLLVVGGIYLIAREMLFPTWREGSDEIEDVRLEIKDEQDPD